MTADTLKWAAVQGENNRVHVVPVDRFGWVISGHILSERCFCRPQESPDVIWSRPFILIHRGEC